jgi:uncharacterized protein YbjQ (UPF0145 family)
MISLSLSAEPNELQRANRMIFTSDDIPDVSIKVIGVVEGMSNGLFSDVRHGSLARLLDEAKSSMCEMALAQGANAIVAARYEVIGRDIEKTILIYGTAVKTSPLTS